jgi:hypothetical protein
VTGPGSPPDAGNGDAVDDRGDEDEDGDGTETEAGTETETEPGSDHGNGHELPTPPDGETRRDDADRGESARRSAAGSPPDDGERVLVDAMLGKLATYLRMCGHDAAYALDRGVEADDDLLTLARSEGRLLVTRDVRLAGRADRALLIESRDVLDQLRELSAAGVDVSLSARPARCGACNGPVERVSSTAGSVPEWVPDPDTVDVWRCVDCGQYFWKGSHWADVRERLADL